MEARRRNTSSGTGRKQSGALSRLARCDVPGVVFSIWSVPEFWRTPDPENADALVAQLDRASDFDSEGREFESLRARQHNILKTKVYLQFSVSFFSRNSWCVLYLINPLNIGISRLVTN
jgi:hypothetical protein